MMPDMTWKEFKRRVEDQITNTGATEDTPIRFIDWSSMAPDVLVTRDVKAGDIYIEEAW